MNILTFQLGYEWLPFKVNGRHLTFREYENNSIRLEKGECSHWGPAIYKWEGAMTEGTHKGKRGVLIGETDDIRARLNQYKSGTQKSGNKYWRENFLRNTTIAYWVLNLQQCSIDNKPIHSNQITSKNSRLVLEQLLVMELLSNCDYSQTWVVNKMQ